jgi:hypothetical protein
LCVLKKSIFIRMKYCISHRRFEAILLLISLILYAGCSSTDEPQPVDCKTSSLTVSFTSTNPTSCAATDGSITASATGGGGPYQFALNSQPYASTANFTSLGAGVYEVKVKDSNGCEQSKSVTLNSTGSTLSATVSLIDSGCKSADGAITINATGGSGPYTYKLNDGATSSSDSFSNLAAGTYLAKVIDNAGCSTTQSVRVFTGTKYSSQIKNIIDANCAVSGCHVSGTGTIAFNSVENVQAQAAGIKSRTQSGSMPKGGPKLPQNQLDLIACWVDDGAPSN